MAQRQRSEFFRSRWGFILAALGAAIGTGNIWRFPKEAASNGGGAFMIAYLIFLFSWSIPLIIAEFAIGKKTRTGTIGTFRIFAGKKYIWMGAWMVFITIAISAYYAVVMGWVIRYTIFSASGGLGGSVDTVSLWNDFMGSPGELVLFQFIAVFISAFVVYRGIRKGIERVSIFLMPLLFGILIFTACWALSRPGSVRGLSYLFVPNMEYLGRGETWIRALAQSAWSAGAGGGLAITYAIYVRRKEDTSLNAFLTGLGDTGASLLAGIAVICTIFALSPSLTAANESLASSGSGLTFIHLTALFGTMPGGSAIATVFFFGMAIAALTSLIALMEIAVRNFIDYGWTRQKAVKFVATVVFLAGIPSALVIMTISGVSIPVYLENQDHIWGLGLLASGFFIAFFAVRRYGIEKLRNQVINTRWSDIYVGKWWEYMLKYIIPIQFLFLLIWFTMDTLITEPASWWRSGSLGLTLLVLEWGMVLAVLIWYNDWIDKKFKAKRLAPEEEDEEFDEAVEAIVVDERR